MLLHVTSFVRQIIEIEINGCFNRRIKMTLKSIMIMTFGVLLSSGAIAQHHHEPASLAGHLAFKQNTLHIHADFPVTPEVGKEALLVLEAKDAVTHQTIALNDQVKVVLWMPSMGHGSAPTKVKPALDSQGNVIPGIFKVTNVYFVMGGAWEVRVILTDNQGVVETQKFDVVFNGGHHH
jgi:YtkA-like